MVQSLVDHPSNESVKNKKFHNSLCLNKNSDCSIIILIQWSSISHYLVDGGGFFVDGFIFMAIL
jgi:hypothetical protein